jgi:hypothetical protein
MVGRKSRFCFLQVTLLTAFRALVFRSMRRDVFLVNLKSVLLLVQCMMAWRGELKTSVVCVENPESQQELTDRGYGAVGHFLF